MAKQGGKFNPEIVAKLLNVAFGLFLNSDVKLNPLNSDDSSLITNSRTMWCDFRDTCVWYSHGETGDPWSLATGEPETLTWLAATGTTVLPASPFSFIELRGAPGDRLTSAVIPCQDEDGLFEFTYWLTAGAKAQACAVDAQSNSGILCSGELLKHFSMPQRAKFNIPGPIIRPFKIAIYASGTGFMVVDNIEYRAKLCKPTTPAPTQAPTTTPLPTAPPVVGSSTPLGGATVAIPLPDRRTGESVTDSMHLICDFGGQFNCQWGPTLSGEEQWGELSGEPDVTTWQGMLDTDKMADMPAAIARHGAGPLTTDTLYCLKGPAQVLLRWWVTEGVTIRVCAFDVIRGEQISCGDSSDDQKHNTAYPGPTVIHFNTPIKTPFVFSIIPDWSSTTSGFIVIDDLAFFGEICDTLPSPEDLGLVPPAFPIITSPPTTTTITTERPPVTFSHSAARRTLPPRFTEGPKVTPRPNPVDIWRPPPSSRSRLTIHPPIPITHESFNRSVVANTFSTVPPRPVPRRIINPRTTTTTEAPIVVFRTPSPPPSSIVDNSQNEWKNSDPNSVCSILSCDFSNGGCGYRTNRAGKSLWALRSTSYGPPISRHTDIRIEPGQGYYVGSRLSPEFANMAILESPSFKINRLKVFQFRYFRATAGTQLRICFETEIFEYQSAAEMSHCALAIPPLDSTNARQWSTGRFTLHPGHIKFYLVAEQESDANGVAVIGLDSFRVAPCRL